MESYCHDEVKERVNSSIHVVVNNEVNNNLKYDKINNADVNKCQILQLKHFFM